MTHAALTEESEAKYLARIPLGRLASRPILLISPFSRVRSREFYHRYCIPVDGGILTT